MKEHDAVCATGTVVRVYANRQTCEVEFCPLTDRTPQVGVIFKLDRVFADDPVSLINRALVMLLAKHEAMGLDWCGPESRIVADAIDHLGAARRLLCGEDDNPEAPSGTWDGGLETSCDGNHAEPVCADPQCWQRTP